jgi:digalactosyldiacylglycerol synthase
MHMRVQMKAVAARKALPVQFRGGRDHLDASMHDYQVFVNPSRSDVVATTTAEALAMGKWVVVADLPCNAFFRTFRNCLTYRCAAFFGVGCMRCCLSEEPPDTLTHAGRRRSLARGCAPRWRPSRRR